MDIFQLKNKQLQISVNSFGAELSSVIAQQTGIEYMWQANELVWPRHAPNLFPIVGKLHEGTYSYESNTYKLSQHGFARDSNFICIEKTDDYLLFELSASEHSLINYPFHFKYQVGYKLIGSKLETHYRVFNMGNDDMYFSVGAHPAFNCPLVENESFSDYELFFPNKQTLSVNTLQDGLITSERKEITLNQNRLSISTELFENDALVFMNSQIEEVHLLSKKSKHGVSLSSKDWPYYGIWSKKNTNQFVCLEPWYGIADTINFKEDISKKEGIITLNSKAEFQCRFDIRFY